MSYAVVAAFPTGWLNGVLEQGLLHQVGWGWLLLVPLSVLAVAHWKRGHVIWSVEQMVEREAVESPSSVPEAVQAEVYGTAERSVTLGTVTHGTVTLGTAEPTADSGQIRWALKQYVKRSPFLRSLPSGGCGPFVAAEAELAKRVFFPEVSVRERVTGGIRWQGRRFFRFLWFFFPTLLLLLLIGER